MKLWVNKGNKQKHKTVCETSHCTLKHMPSIINTSFYSC